jgi:ERCC4-type nuclease
MTLIIDSREPRHLIDALLEQVPGSRIQTLPYGDYIIEGSNQRFIIERKTVRDLFASMNDNRIWDQFKGIERFEGYKRLLLVEGRFWDAWKWDKSLTMARYTGLKVSVLYGWENMSHVSTENQDETVDFIKRLAKKVGNAEEETFTRSLGFTKINRTEDEKSIDGVRWPDGVGEAKAAELLERFKTVEKIARASVKELTYVLGEKDAVEVFEAFRHKYGSKKKKVKKEVADGAEASEGK